MKESKYWKSSSGKINCHLCPHNCNIEEGSTGRCKVRKAKDNKLYSMNYGKAVSINVDPVEKKPLYHFLPKTNTLSIGTVGCNLYCKHCQNWEIATAFPGQMQELDLPAEVVVQLALDKGCKSISYTYNEPTIFHEYATDIAKLAKEKGLMNILVTNGYINRAPAEDFCKVMDAVNVDLKAFNKEFYYKVCHSKFSPILEAIKIYKNIWLEITNLIIEGENDSSEDIEDMCKWIKDNVGPHVPIHFSRAIPMHKMKDINPTPRETLLKARDIARKYLDYVYIGNIRIEDSTNTYCPNCGKLIFDRENGSKEEHICDCGKAIKGVWE
ncbi:MAG: AmmeMemoRadiSam system radical SAM enzyme [Nanobdellota archaeon]